MGDTVTLHNGIQLYIQRDKNCAKLGCAVAFRAGTKYEKGGERGLTHMLEHMMFRRLGDIGQRELYRFTRRMGTNMRGITYRDMLYFGITVSARHEAEQIGLLRRLFERPEWSREEFEAERGVVLRQMENRYYGKTEEFINRRYLPKSLGGYIMGDAETVKKMSPEQLCEFHERIMVPENACAVIYGDISRDGLDEILKLGEIRRSAEQVRRRNCNSADEILQSNAKTGGIHYLESGGGGSDIELLFRIQRRDIRTAELLSAALGMGDGSELSLQLRETDAITDEVDSYIEELDGFAYLGISVYVGNEALTLALERISDVLKRVRDGIGEQRFVEHRSYLASWTRLNCCGEPHQECLTAARNGFILNEGIFGCRDLAAAYEQVSYDEFCTLARRVLISDNMTAMIAGDRHVILSRKVRRCAEKALMATD